MDQTSVGRLKRKCQFIVEKKNRPCRMWALEDERFCGEHTIHDTENSSTTNVVPEDRIRIKCPLDPSHTCFLKKLQKHLKVCNAREKDRPAYYVRDINGGDAVVQVGGKTIHQLSDRALLDLLDRISSLHADHVPPQEVAEDATHAALADSLGNPAFGPDTLKHLRQNSALLGVLRDAALLDGERTFVELGSGKAQLSFWLARAVNSRSQIVLVDFASHRHKAENKLKDLADMPDIQRLKIDIRHLSLAGCDACTGRPVVAISKHLCGAATDLGIRAATAGMDSRTPAVSRPDSSPPPGDTDSVKTEPSTTPAVKTEPSATPAVRTETPAPPAVKTETSAPPGSQNGSAAPRTVNTEPAAPPAVTTELPTGGGTEPAAAGGAELPPGGGTEPAAAEGADVRGILIAVCCHHRVDWASYVGKQFLQECGFSGEDFTALRGVAAWATCGTPSWESADLHRPGRENRRTERIGQQRGQPDAASSGQTAADETTASQTAAGSAAAGRTDPDPDQPISDETEPETAVADAVATEPSEAVAAPEQGAGDALQKRPAVSTEHDDSKRARLDDLGPAEDKPGPGSREASAGRYQRLGLTPEQRTSAGFMCKRLLDEGRRRYLAERGFTARMVRYVPASVSPENVLMLATRR